jgi:MFS family permease
MQPKHYGVLSLPIIVGSLGFFVDIYDLQVFLLTRIDSFTELGVTDSNAQQAVGESILSWQFWGLAIGGLLWGILGDKKGRKSVLFGSIFVYSAATLANGFVHDITSYTILRFIAGLGLAGELGASITITAELLPKEKRGLAAAVIATSGVMGTIVCYFVKSLSGDNWRLCYYVGGAMGLVLLFLRARVFDSSMYASVKEGGVRMGNLLMIFSKRERFFRYLRGILIGLPVWYVIGVVIAFSERFAKEFGIDGFDQPKSLMLQYVALAFGDLSGGILANVWKSRKKAIYFFYSILTVVIVLFFLTKGGGSAFNMYLFCMALGFGSGISVLYITMSAEQFGTNLRATAAISIPNMVRVFTIPMFWVFTLLRSKELLNDYLNAAFVLGLIVIAVSWTAAWYTKETFGKSMEFIEK